jgi:hypothetical protein
MNIMKGKELFEELRKLINIPPHCKSLVLRVGLDEPVILETVCYLTEKETRPVEN